MQRTHRIVFVLVMTIVAAGTVLAGGSQEPKRQTDPIVGGVAARLVVTEGEHFTHAMRVMPLVRVRNPTPDAITSATPKGGFELQTSIPDTGEPIWIFFEVNNSTDFNDAYPDTVAEGDPAYSGGKWGSGQPALVYGARIDPAASGTPGVIQLRLLGHASPDGSDGEIYTDLSGITTARTIVDSVEVRFPRTVAQRSDDPRSDR